MVENPDTWGSAERAVNQALIDYDFDVARGRFGLSKARRITDALRNAGFDLDDHCSNGIDECPVHGIACPQPEPDLP